jgi:exodeoxyribonuclease VII small subunit
MAAKTESFEKSLEKLEDIVSKLEDGDLSLDESLKLFEEGVKLSRECQERLAQAERKIQKLTAEGDGAFKLTDINPDSASEDSNEIGRGGSLDDDEF